MTLKCFSRPASPTDDNFTLAPSACTHFRAFQLRDKASWLAQCSVTVTVTVTAKAKAQCLWRWAPRRQAPVIPHPSPSKLTMTTTQHKPRTGRCMGRLRQIQHLSYRALQRLFRSAGELLVPVTNAYAAPDAPPQLFGSRKH